MKITFLPLALMIPVSLCVCSCGGKKKSGGTPFGSAMISSENGISFVDEHYRFSIRGLGPKWRLLDEAERTKILPDAAALATMTGGTYGAVIVEAYQGDLRAYTELITSNMQSASFDFKAEEIREVEFNGSKAHRRTITATRQGIEFNYELMTFLHQGMAYQVLASRPSKEGTHDSLEEFIAAVHLEEGQVKIPPPPSPPDSAGIGNRIEKGRFESAISGLSVAPRDPWGLMWGQALTSLDPNVETGIQRPDQGLFITVSHNPVAEEERARFIDSLEAFIPKDAQSLGTTTWSFGGQPVKFVGAQLPGPPRIRMYLGHVVRNGRGMQVKAWHIDQGGVDRTESIDEGMKSFEFLDAETAAELQARLEKAADMNGSVGGSYSVRNGVYRGFEEGIVWQRPGGFWRIDSGDDARKTNKDVSLRAKEVKSGLNLQLVVDEHGEKSPREFHDSVVSMLKEKGFSEGSKRLNPVMVDGHEVLRSCLIYQGNDTDIEYQVGTVIAGDKSYQLNCFAPVALMAGQTELTRQALAGFSFPGDKLRAVESRGGRHRDVRMGFELRVPSGMTLDSQPPNEVLSKLGSWTVIKDKRRWINHLAMHTGTAGDDALTASKMVNQIFKLNLDRASTKGSSEKPDTIAGLPASVRSGMTGGTHMKIAVFRQGGVLHVGMVLAPTERQLETLFSEYKAGFSLIP